MSDLSDHPIHPWYGPCDGFAGGECEECRQTFYLARAVVETARAMRNKREFDAQIVERNDWERFQDALKAYDAQKGSE